jgi:hypothetical protein
MINNKSGYHASSEVNGKDCWSCHSEHHGRKFRIINFNPKSFDHDKTGFSLIDSHKKADCNDCHQAKNISDSELRKRNDTYLGLNQYCFSCHEDYHQKTLDDDCSKCHDTKSFRPAVKFNHNNSQFKLTGAHTNKECISCHPKEIKNSKETQKFKGVAFATCGSCHKDVHQGRFGTDCKSCHNTTDFKTINQSAFDHSRTNFPLLGKHKIVSCNKCHDSEANKKPAHQNCTDCHKDYHNNQFIVNNILQDCDDCHTADGFRPSTYTIETHNYSEFKLTGSHLATPCESCHYKTETWLFRNLGNDCIECHTNIHKDELADKYLPGNDCEYCHKTESWSNISFNHDLTNFSLFGKHKEQRCGNCHTKKDLLDQDKIVFSSLTENCESCHTDIHLGQFKVDDKSDCEKCHTFNDWKPDRFDHERTNFSLKGAHKKVECIKCHPQSFKDGKVFVKFKLEDFKCAVCHK